MQKCEKAQIGLKLTEIYCRFRKYQNKRYFECFKLEKCQTLTLENFAQKWSILVQKTTLNFFTKC